MSDLEPPSPASPAAGAPRVWTRYVAIGDSFTEGLCDVNPEHPDRYAGWADRLASHLSAAAEADGRDFHYANLAVRGRLLEDVVGRQLDTALAFEPDLVSVVGGGNDILRGRIEIDLLAGMLERAVAAVRAAGADVLLATPVDPAGAAFIRRTREPAGEYAERIRDIAARHGGRVVDQWTMAYLRDWRMWADDRIHMSAEGHRRVALAALDALGHPTDRDDWYTPLPPAPPVPRHRQLAADAQWVGKHLAPWLGRRVRRRSSGDEFRAKHAGPVPHR